MSRRPFDGLTPAPAGDHARWIVDGLSREPPAVAFVVPPGFESIVRIHHPLESGRRWSDELPEYLRRGSGPHPDGDPAQPLEVAMCPEEVVDRLLPVLAPPGAPPLRCHYAVWVGWGDLRPGGVNVGWYTGPGGRWVAAWAKRRTRRQVQRALRRSYRPIERFIRRCAHVDWWGGREMFLFDGDVSAVVNVGSPARPSGSTAGIRRRGPQWWWPEDRSWFVATEIDDPWTYVAGSRALVDRVLDLDLEAIAVEYTDSW